MEAFEQLARDNDGLFLDDGKWVEEPVLEMDTMATDQEWTDSSVWEFAESDATFHHKYTNRPTGCDDYYQRIHVITEYDEVSPYQRIVTYTFNRKRELMSIYIKTSSAESKWKFHVAFDENSSWLVHNLDDSDIKFINHQ